MPPRKVINQDKAKTGDASKAKVAGKTTGKGGEKKGLGHIPVLSKILGGKI